MSEKVESPDGWDKKLIADITTLKRDNIPSDEQDELPHVGLEHLEQFSPRISSESSDNVSSNKYRFEEGDILFGQIRSYLEKVCIADREGVCSTDIFVIDPNGVNRNYLWALILSEEVNRWSQRASTGTKMPRVQWNAFVNKEVPVPPVGEQERIASVLYTVDKHVEALDQRHSSLQDLKHALMQDLLTGKRRFDGEEVNLSSDEFEGYKVDDEPPVVLANWSGMKLPEGWSRENIGDIIDVTTGDSFSSDRFEDEGDYILIKNKTVKEQEPEVYISGDIDEQYIIEEGDLLVTMDGEFTSREWKLGEAALNQRVCKVEPKNGLHKRFLRYALEYPLSHIQDYKAGTTVKHLSTKDFNDILLPVPPKVEQERIASVLYTVDEMIARTSELRDEYKQLKRGLMQDLLSGEVRTSAELDVMDEVTA